MPKHQFLYLALVIVFAASSIAALQTETKTAGAAGDSKVSVAAVETKSSEAATALSSELKKKIATLIDTHIARQATKDKLPLSSGVGTYPATYRENVRILLEESVEAALNHFPDKKSLQTFTGYASGGLELEYLLLKALALAGFDQIHVINIVDIQYPLGFYAAGSTAFTPLPGPALPQAEAAKLDTIQQFREQFMAARLNVFYSIYNHTFASLDDKNNALKTKSDLIFMSNYQEAAIPSEKEYKAHVEEYRKRHKDLAGQAFDYISFANAHKDALVIETGFSGTMSVLINYTVPTPPSRITHLILEFSIEAHKALNALAQTTAINPKQATMPQRMKWVQANGDAYRSLQLFNKKQEEILGRLKNQPLLLSYFETMKNKFNQIQQQLQERKWLQKLKAIPSGIGPDAKS